MAEPTLIVVREHQLTSMAGKPTPPPGGVAKGRKRRRRGEVPPDVMAFRFDSLLGKELKRLLASKDSPDPDFLAIVERRLKAIGQTKEPEPVQAKPDQKDDNAMAAIREALESARTSPAASVGLQEPADGIKPG